MGGGGIRVGSWVVIGRGGVRGSYLALVAFDPFEHGDEVPCGGKCVFDPIALFSLRIT